MPRHVVKRHMMMWYIVEKLDLYVEDEERDDDGEDRSDSEGRAGVTSPANGANLSAEEGFGLFSLFSLFLEKPTFHEGACSKAFCSGRQPWSRLTWHDRW